MPIIVSLLQSLSSPPSLFVYTLSPSLSLSIFVLFFLFCLSLYFFDIVELIYGGKDLESHAKYQWKVRVWDQDDSVTPWSALASFTTSVLCILFPSPLPFSFHAKLPLGLYSYFLLSLYLYSFTDERKMAIGVLSGSHHKQALHPPPTTSEKTSPSLPPRKSIKLWLVSQA